MHDTSVQLVHQPTISKSPPPAVLLKISLPPSKDQKNATNIVLTTKIVLQNYPQEYIEFLLNFLWNLCIPSWLGENFQIYGVSINGKMHLQVKKLNLDIFTHAPPSKDFPQVLTITLQAEGNYRFPRSRVLPKTTPPPPPPPLAIVERGGGNYAVTVPVSWEQLL